MAFHHIAIATRDLEATHRFYTEAMGFQLVRVEAMPAGMPDSPGWARHLFYDTGNGEMFAIWDLHVEEIDDFDPAISLGLGLPNWVNHLAFGASDLADLESSKQRWLSHGYDVAEIDHGWCTSIYTDDPNGIMVEFCTTTRAFTEDDHRKAQELLRAEQPALATPPEVKFFTAG